MAGVLKELIETKPRYPIVIRRGGPYEEEAKRMMDEAAKKHNLDITWIGGEMSLREACVFFAKKINA